MRIDTSRKVKSYLNRKDQRRLLALCGVLVLVMIASKMAANPANWAWMFGGQKATSEEQASSKDAKTSVETSPPIRPPLKDGEFRVPPGDKRVETPGKKTTPENGGKQKQPRLVANIDKSSVEIHSSILSAVEDRSWDIRPQEAETYFRVLEHAVGVSQRDLQRVSRENVALSVLINSPDDYRGAAITIDGELYQIRSLPDVLGGDKREGQSAGKTIPLYDAWIRTPGSDKTPVRVVFSELPEGMDAPVKTREFDPPVAVRVTGYFFKVQKYEIDGDRDGFAPLVLAKRLRIFENSATSHRTVSAAPYIVGFICFVLAALAFAIWRFSIGDRAFHQKHLQRIAEPSNAEKIAMNDLPAADAEDLFAHLAEGDSEAVEEK